MAGSSAGSSTVVATGRLFAPQGSIITLAIEEVDNPPVYRYDVWLDGVLQCADQELSRSQSEAVRQFSQQYNALFEHRSRPQLAADALQELGNSLYNLWLAPFWDDIQGKIAAKSHSTLVIASSLPAILNLPWELLRLPSGSFIGFDAKYGIRRLPWHDRTLEPFTGTPPPRPLRILFMACAPKDQANLDYEREEKVVLEAVAHAGPNVVFDSCDLGTFEELQDRIIQFEPQIVHLTGHGIVREDGLVYFAFEDERGETDLRSSEDIRQDMFAGSSVQCAFISGCQTGKAPPVAAVGGICQGLVSEEVPLAIGWTASIADDVATQFTETLYRTQADGDTVNGALTKARGSIKRVCEERGDPSWTLPVLYAISTQQQVFDIDLAHPPILPRRNSMVQEALPGMKEGYTDYFVGRRRELQELLPALREGRAQIVLLTGLGGAGKSTLATRLARKLQTEGYIPLPIPSSREKPLSPGRIIEVCRRALLATNLREAHAILGDGSIVEEDRLQYLITVLNQQRFVLVLDNFESNLNDRTRTFKDLQLAAFYQSLLESFGGGSRQLITSRYPPAYPAQLPPKAHRKVLEEFPEADFLKFLLGNQQVEERYYRGELTRDLLEEVYRVFGGTPRFLDQIREVLTTISADDLQRELQAVQMPEQGKGEEDGEQGVLRAKQQQYFERIVTSRLYGYLDKPSRRALSRAAVYGVPVTVAGLAAVDGEPEGQVRSYAQQWQDYALAHKKQSGGGSDLWTVYGIVRSCLLGQLTGEEQHAAHRAAGDFLRDLERQDREGELGLSWIDCLLEARGQYLAAQEWERARRLTDRISNAYLGPGLYRDIIRLNEELLTHEQHPGPMTWMGRAYSELADYRKAREWYGRGLEAAGTTVPDEAAIAWHGLATIDLNEGNYAAAREKFERSLQMRQEIGDRAGEAAGFYQLGMLAAQMGRKEEGLRLVALCYLIDQSIGHGDTENDFRAAAGMASELDYSQDQFDTMLREVAVAYRSDGGWGLLAAASDPEG